MPIRIPENLPAFETLKKEGVDVMAERVADRQDIRPLRFALLNLMPKKIETETQFARLIGATPLQIELHLIRMSDHVSKNTAEAHMDTFYTPFQEMKAERFDGLIMTGAPVEHLDYEDVNYWDELGEIFEWTQTHVNHTMAVCWAGMAALKHFHDIPKDLLDAKAFGCFRHENLAPTSPFLRGISDDFLVPVSRWTEIKRAHLQANDALEILVDAPQTGPCIIEDAKRNMLITLNHFEYDSLTLKGEYDRDVAAGKPINIPDNYYPNNDPKRPPQNRWKSTAHLLYGNWVNEIYQTTPYELNKIGLERHDPRL